MTRAMVEGPQEAASKTVASPSRHPAHSRVPCSHRRDLAPLSYSDLNEVRTLRGNYSSQGVFTF